MTAEEMRKRVLALIKGYLQLPAVQGSEPAVDTLNALAGDIMMIQTQNQGNVVDELARKLSKRLRETLK